jgi:hypothetical protein
MEKTLSSLNVGLKYPPQIVACGVEEAASDCGFEKGCPLGGGYQIQMISLETGQ